MDILQPKRPKPTLDDDDPNRFTKNRRTLVVLHSGLILVCEAFDRQQAGSADLFDVHLAAALPAGVTTGPLAWLRVRSAEIAAWAPLDREAAA